MSNRARSGIAVLIAALIAACQGTAGSSPSPSATPASHTGSPSAPPSPTRTGAATPAATPTPDSPGLRVYHSLVGLDEGDGILLVGGETASPPAGGVPLTDVWNLDDGAWMYRGDDGQFADAIAYDSGSGLVVSCGLGCWTYDVAANSWSEAPQSSGPFDFHGARMAYDAKSDRLVLFTGSGETWAYDVDANAWSEMSPDAHPPGRKFGALVYDEGSDRVVLFGGGTDREDLGDTWAYDHDTDTWTELHPAVSPAPRIYQAMAYDPGTDRIILFAGVAGPFLGELPFDDTWALDVDTGTWTALAPATSPSARGWHAVALDRAAGRIVLFGGGPDRDHGTAETWVFDPVAVTWSAAD